MQVKLLRQVLTGESNIIPSKVGTVVDLSDEDGKYFVDNGLAVEVEKADKKAPEASNKKAPEAEKKSK